MADKGAWVTIGQLAQRSGVATSALRYYEEQGLIVSMRTQAGHRRFPRHTLRRVAFLIAAQSVGLSLARIRTALDELPNARTPTNADWAFLARSWLPMISARITELERLRDGITSCIGCGCLSLRVCRLYNPRDVAGNIGAGARYLIGDPPPSLSKKGKQRGTE